MPPPPINIPIDDVTLLEFTVKPNADATKNKIEISYDGGLVQSTIKAGEIHKWLIALDGTGKMIFVDSILTAVDTAAKLQRVFAFDSATLSFSVDTSSSGTCFLIGHGDLRPVGAEAHYNIDTTGGNPIYVIVSIDNANHCIINFV